MPFLNKPVILFDIDYTLFDTRHFKDSNLTDFKLYPEVIETLTKLSQTAVLGIFSEGEPEFQMAKLKITGIEKFFAKDHIYIQKLKESKIKEMSGIYSEDTLYIVDDKLLLLSAIKDAISHAVTVWVKRGEYAEKIPSLPGFTPGASIDDLSQLTSVLEIVQNYP